MTLTHGGRDYIVEVVDSEHVLIDGQIVEVAREGNGIVRGNGASIGRAWTAASGATRWVFVDGRVYEIDASTDASPRRGAGHHGSLTAPMPATVRQILVAPGAAVARGETVIILEAMKMELPVRAPAKGVIASVLCREGELVQPGVPLIEITES